MSDPTSTDSTPDESADQTAAEAPQAQSLEAEAAATEAPQIETPEPETSAPEISEPETSAPETPEPEVPHIETAGAQGSAPSAPPVVSPAVLARAASGVPTPATLAGRVQPVLRSGLRSSEFGRVADDGTVYVKTPEGEREVGSYPGATPEEALAYFTRKFDETSAQADLLLQRVTQTDLSTKEAGDGLTKLRTAMTDLRAVGDLVALGNKVENIATAVEARRQVEAADRAAAREAAAARRLEIVVAAEKIAVQPEERIQWKSSSSTMRELLEDWKTAQRDGPKLDRETEQSLWRRLSGARNTFDKLRRVHFAQLTSTQGAAKAAKEELVEEAERLAGSTEWGTTAGAFKRLMDRWRQAGRASRSDDDALWVRFKTAQDGFFAAKDSVVAAENEEFSGNLIVKEELLTQAQALLPVKDLDATKNALRAIQDKWDVAGKVPRADMDRIERAMRRVESAVREADDRKWQRSNPEVAARAQSLVTQLEAACEELRADLAKAEAGGDARAVAKARDALTAREAWLGQARAGLAEFGG